MNERLRADALAIYGAGLRAADPFAAVSRLLGRYGRALVVNGKPAHELGRGRAIVAGAGKAGAPMAQAVEAVLGDALDAGAVVVKYGHVAPTRRVKVLEAGHPLPDENGIRATRELKALLEGLAEDDLVLCLISGGGSALLELPAEGVTLADLTALTEALLRSGARIEEMNAVRKHLSRVKGGGLARLAHPARVVTLILSDVLGSPVDAIASGPTAPDASTFQEALAVLDRYGLREKVPASVLTHLERGARGEIPDTPKAGDALFARRGA
jgi:hydroxypyruvate reductase